MENILHPKLIWLTIVHTMGAATNRKTYNKVRRRQAMLKGMYQTVDVRGRGGRRERGSSIRISRRSGWSGKLWLTLKRSTISHIAIVVSVRTDDNHQVVNWIKAASVYQDTCWTNCQTRYSEQKNSLMLCNYNTCSGYCGLVRATQENKISRKTN